MRYPILTRKLKGRSVAVASALITVAAVLTAEVYLGAGTGRARAAPSGAPVAQPGAPPSADNQPPPATVTLSDSQLGSITVATVTEREFFAEKKAGGKI